MYSSEIVAHEARLVKPSLADGHYTSHVNHIPQDPDNTMNKKLINNFETQRKESSNAHEMPNRILGNEENFHCLPMREGLVERDAIINPSKNLERHSEVKLRALLEKQKNKQELTAVFQEASQNFTSAARQQLALLDSKISSLQSNRPEQR
mmetsp:Transcript_22637/g.43243  ORF Transcript_22637/g.43243 Transcript_22637/m.43243 type:complete len:151 (+) Transcript_22637:344-796(+)